MFCPWKYEEKLPSKVGYLKQGFSLLPGLPKWAFSNMNFDSCLELFYSLHGWGNCTPAPPVPPALMLRMVSWLLVKVPTGWFTEFDTGSRHLYAKIAQWKIDHLGYRILQKILEKKIWKIIHSNEIHITFQLPKLENGCSKFPQKALASAYCDVASSTLVYYSILELFGQISLYKPSENVLLTETYFCSQLYGVWLDSNFGPFACRSNALSAQLCA